MISGTIRNREALIELDVSGPSQSPRHVEAVLDTGYNGYLTLPRQLVSALGLPFAGHRRGTLADGSVTRMEVYMASVGWHGRQKEVLISQTAGTPLIGMALLEGSPLMMDVVDGGTVTIEELTSAP